MTIRFQLLLFVITGYLLVIAVFLFSIIQRDKVQEETSAESLVILYESAWYQNYNNNYEFMSKWIPNIGENGNCLLYTSPSPRDPWKSRMPSSA